MLSAAAEEDGNGGDEFGATAAVAGSGRRTALATLGAVLVSAVGPAVPPAFALKKRNEALCGTGFFEHIYEYKCTEIGDIEDEGYSRAMNAEENGLTDGLMGKLGVIDGENGNNNNNNYDPFGDKKNTAKGDKPKDRNSNSSNNS